MMSQLTQFLAEDFQRTIDIVDYLYNYGGGFGTWVSNNMFSYTYVPNPNVNSTWASSLETKMNNHLADVKDLWDYNRANDERAARMQDVAVQTLRRIRDHSRSV